MSVIWRTESDNEVALHILDRQGPAGLARLRGHVRPGLHRRRDRFVLARDPVGIKPLYWARHDGTVVAASELKAFDPGIRAMVEAFPPGHYWTPRRPGALRHRRVRCGPEGRSTTERSGRRGGRRSARSW